jgi:hypothetical protein
MAPDDLEVSSSPPGQKSPGILSSLKESVRRFSKSDDAVPAQAAKPSRSRRQVVEVSLPLRPPFSTASPSSQVVPPPSLPLAYGAVPSSSQGRHRLPSLSSLEPAYPPQGVSHHQPPPVLSQPPLSDHMSPPSLPPPSPYSFSGPELSSSSIASYSTGVFSNLDPSSPVYPYELERLQLEFRKSQENLRLEREHSERQRELFTRERIERERRHQEDIANLRKELDSKGKRRM